MIAAAVEWTSMKKITNDKLCSSVHEKPCFDHLDGQISWELTTMDCSSNYHTDSNYYFLLRDNVQLSSKRHDSINLSTELDMVR